MEHPIDEAIRKHPDIFTESARKFEGEAFEEALSRWAREFPEEAAAYEDSVGKGETMPMEILDYWDDIEEMAKRYPKLSSVVVARKWMAENPGGSSRIAGKRRTILAAMCAKSHFPPGKETRTTHRLRQILNSLAGGHSVFRALSPRTTTA